MLCQNRLFDDTFIAVNDLADILGMSSSSIRNILKELDAKEYILKAKNGKKIGYSANLTKLDELAQ